LSTFDSLCNTVSFVILKREFCSVFFMYFQSILLFKCCDKMSGSESFHSELQKDLIMICLVSNACYVI